MKRYLLSLLVLLALALGAQAQGLMHVNMKDGTMMNIFVSEVESVTFDIDSEDPNINNPDDPTVTGEAIDITGSSATIVGYANNIRDNESTDLKIGIIYCTEGTPNKSNGTQKTVSQSQVAGDGKYAISLTGLSRGTTYYYRSFVYQSGLWFYGKVRSFSTIGQDVTANFQTGAATSITCFSAKVSAQMNLTTTLSYSSMSYGICYGTESEPTTQLKVSSKDSEGNYTVQLRALEGNTIYYYRPYATVDGTTYYGQTSSFKTIPDNVVETGEVDADGNVRSRLTIGGGAYSTLEVGLCWSKTSELPTVNDNTANTNELDDENYYVIAPQFRVGRYYYRAYVKIDEVAHYGEVKTIDYFNECNGHDYVDLGLPSGMIWATMNIGASTPEQYGDSFAWGETEPKSTYSWSNYKWCNGSSSALTKYYAVDKKATLELEDDAAHIKWGGLWRMPTYEELKELFTNCMWTWTTLNGTNGYEGVGPNGNSIFFPTDPIGISGGYWSSSLQNNTHTLAEYLVLNSENVYITQGSRYIGRSVRAVCQ